MNRTRLAVAVLLCVVGGALSVLLLSTHYGVPLFGEAALLACGEGGGCDIVAQSRYAKFLGLPLAAWGFLFYGSVFALLIPSLLGRVEETPDPGPSLGFFLFGLALVIDAVLLGLQAFVIQAFCKFCIATYAVNGLALIALWPFRQLSQAMNFVFMPETRRALLAWMVASVAVAATAIAFNAGLVDRRALAGTSILGIPPMIQAPERVEKGSAQEQLALAQAEAKKWKDTLDDERRLQQYLTEKAKADFNGSSVATLDLSRAPTQGSPQGPIVVVSYSDFMCPFCRDLAASLRSYFPTTGNRVRVYYKHFPLDMTCNAQVGRTVHPGACELSKGGICAAESGRFWEYHDKVFAQTWDRATRDDVLRIGTAAGLDRVQFNACLDAAATKGRLAADIEEGKRIGVESTPTVVINGRKLKSVNVFLLAIEEERKRLNLAPLSGSPSPRKP